ncbi:MAG: divergent polysaccharide deacetylase family protein [Deltaproteobacteria bacterium]|nr:divergent polysaccharide deacetylase family protein [Deltaproteobacteria bacterium]
MPTDKRKTKKRRTTSKKKSTQKRWVSTHLAIGLAGLLLVAGAFGYGMYRIMNSRLSRQTPLFEVYPSRRGTEAKVKEIDRCIYDALLALNVPGKDVEFKVVETKGNNKESWTFSEMEIHLPASVQSEAIKRTFYKKFSHILPGKSLHFQQSGKHKTILDLSINGHRTHQLVFLTTTKLRPVISPQRKLPKVAILIDDMGYDKRMAAKFIKLDGKISFSVLPYSPFEESIATSLHETGHDVLLHLPMEPIGYPHVNPGDGALLCSMDTDKLSDQLRKDLERVPFVVGVNNHMGSRFTQDLAKMRQVFTILKKRNLFFIDSRTDPKSRCAEAAQVLQLRFAERNVFLDNVQEANAIRFQIKRLLSIANTKGCAIGIGHPHPITLQVLKEELPSIRKKVELVPVSELIG